MTEKPVSMRLPSLTSRMERVSALLQQFSQLLASHTDDTPANFLDIETVYRNIYDAAHDPRWEIRAKIAADLPYTRHSFWDLCALLAEHPHTTDIPHLAVSLAKDRTLQVRLSFIQSLRRDWPSILQMYAPEIEASETSDASETLDVLGTPDTSEALGVPKIPEAPEALEALEASKVSELSASKPAVCNPAACGSAVHGLVLCDGVIQKCLSALGKDCDVRVRRELSAFDRLPSAILQILLHDDDRTVRYHLCKQMYLSSTMAAFLLSVAPECLLPHPRLYAWLRTDPDFLRHATMTPPVVYAALAANLAPSVVWLFVERLLLTADSYLCRVVIAALSSLPQDKSAYIDFLRRHPHIHPAYDQQTALLWIFDDVVCQKSMRHLMAMLRVEVLPAAILEKIITRVDPDAGIPQPSAKPLTEPLHSLLQHPSCPHSIIGQYIHSIAGLPIVSLRYQQLLSALLHYPHLTSSDLHQLWFCVNHIADLDVLLDKIQHFLQNPQIPSTTLVDIANMLESFSNTDIYHDDLFSETAYLRRQLCLHPACSSSIHEKWHNDPSPWVRSVVHAGKFSAASPSSTPTPLQMHAQTHAQTQIQTQILDDMLADVLGLLKD